MENQIVKNGRKGTGRLRTGVRLRPSGGVTHRFSEGSQEALREDMTVILHYWTAQLRYISQQTGIFFCLFLFLSFFWGKMVRSQLILSLTSPCMAADAFAVYFRLQQTWSCLSWELLRPFAQQIAALRAAGVGAPKYLAKCITLWGRTGGKCTVKCIT